MTSRTRSIAGVTLLFALVCTRADAQTLAVGDPAPPLVAERYLKGEKVEKFEPDRTYLIDFFEISQKSCIDNALMLTRLQEKYRTQGLRVIGVPAQERSSFKVEAFVESMDEDMGYTVALDDVPVQEWGKIHCAWLIASKSEAYPVAFLVKGGKIAWIGETQRVGEVVEKVMAPGFDFARFTTELRAERAEAGRLAQKLEAVKKKLEILGDEVNDKQRLRLIDKAIADEPRLEKSLCGQKYDLLRRISRDMAVDYSQRLIDSSEPEKLVTLAYSLICYPARDDADHARDNEIGLKAARRADELTRGADLNCTISLAWAYFANGDRKRAVEYQQKGIRMSKEGNAPALKDALKLYQQDPTAPPLAPGP